MKTNLKALEKLAEFCAKQGVNIKVGHKPYCDTSTKTIWIMAGSKHGVAETIHESAHIKLTPDKLGRIASNPWESTVLNTIEDARINKLMLKEHPNLKTFLEQERVYLSMLRKKILFEKKESILWDMLLTLEGFPEFALNEPFTQNYIKKFDLLGKSRMLIGYINKRQLKRAKMMLKLISFIIWKVEKVKITMNDWKDMKKHFLRGVLYESAHNSFGL